LYFSTGTISFFVAVPGLAKIGRGKRMGKQKKQIEHDEIVRRFGNRLREIRTSRGMTQAELAEQANVSTAYVGRLERGGAAPGIDLVEKLARALGATAADMLPAAETPDPGAVLREQARRLFDALVQTEDQATLSLLTQILARLTQTTSIGD
jgi:transcriptional regulator with XRE-family HTH domain